MAIIVLPDTPADPRMVAYLRDAVGPVLCRHRSGRPWIIGRAQYGDLVVSRNRTLDVAVLGHAAIDEVWLDDAIKNSRTVDDLEKAAAEIVEFDVILLAHSKGNLRAQAPAFLTRSLFWTEIDGRYVISDEQYPLALLNGLEPDVGVLAFRLSNAEVSHPFSRQPVWRGVHGLGVGEYLRAEGPSSPVRRTWWTPPDPDQAVESLAPALTQGIRDALALRTRGRATVSTDLSGGLDSTTLSFFTAETGLRHHTFFLRTDNPSNNDWKWSQRAADEMRSEHVTASYQMVMDTLRDDTDVALDRFPEGPNGLSMTVAATPVIERELAGTESSLHLNGHAGDALFGEVSTMVWSFMRSRASGRFAWLWKYRTMNRMPVLATVRMAAKNESFSDELQRLAKGEFHRPKHDIVDYSSWIETPHPPAPLTEHAKSQIALVARRELEQGAQALSGDKTIHQILSYLAAHGSATRRMNHAARSMQFDSPYLDRRVVGPALALNIADRTRKHPIKPLLAAARPPSMSLEYFTRRDKGDYTAEVFDQHSKLVDSARELFTGTTALEELGLVSGAEVVRSLDGYSVDGASYGEVAELEFAERWLRSAQAERRSQVQWRNFS